MVEKSKLLKAKEWMIKRYSQDKPTTTVQAAERFNVSRPDLHHFSKDYDDGKVCKSCGRRLKANATAAAMAVKSGTPIEEAAAANGVTVAGVRKAITRANTDPKGRESRRCNDCGQVPRLSS